MGNLGAFLKHDGDTRPGEHTKSELEAMALIEIVDLPIKDGDFP